GDRQREVYLPTGVAEVVVMEVDRPVLLRRVNEVLLPGLPVMARDRARRDVDRAAVQAIRGHVGDPPRRADAALCDLLVEIPGTAERGAVRTLDLHVHPVAPENCSVDSRAVQLAVVV